MKRRRILIALRDVVIPSAAEGSFLHCGQYHIGTGRKTTPWCYVFLLSHIHRFSVCKEDFSLSLEMTIRESHQSLAAHPCFQTLGDIPFPYRHRKRSRGIFLALRSVSHRHGQENDALVLRISAFAHPSFLGLQRRFLAFARNDDTRESPVTSCSSLLSNFRVSLWGVPSLGCE